MDFRPTYKMMSKKFGSVQGVTQEELLSAMIGTKRHSRQAIKEAEAKIRARRNEQEGVQLVPIEKVKKKDVFRLPGKDRVYVAEGYCRFNKKYSACRWDDINHFIYKKKGTLVEINFDF